MPIVAVELPFLGAEMAVGNYPLPKTKRSAAALWAVSALTALIGGARAEPTRTVEQMLNNNDKRTSAARARVSALSAYQCNRRDIIQSCG